MDSPQESIAGEWWLPENPSERRTGTVKYGDGRFPNLEILQGWHEAPEIPTSDGGSITMLDSFEPTRPGASHDIFDRAVIHGTTVGLEPMSLLKARDYPGTIHIGNALGSIHKRVVEASVLVIGAHVDSLDSLMVSEMHLAHSCGSLMLQETGLSQFIWNESPDDEGGGFDVKWRETAPIVAQLSNGVSLTLGTTGSASPVRRNGDSVSTHMQSTPRLSISSDAEWGFFELWTGVLAPLNSLVRFAANHHGGWLRINGSSSGMPVQIFHREIAPPLSEDISLRHRPTFYLDRVSDDLAPVVETWLALMDELGSSVQQGLNALESTESAERVRQLALALEGLPDTSQYESPFREFWEAIKKALKAAVPTSLEDAIVNRAGSMLGPSLQDRLEILAEEIEAREVEVPASVRGAFGDVKTVRNAMSHPRNNEQLSQAEIRRADACATALFRAAILARLPFDVTAGCRSILGEANDEIEQWS